jgi:hypothetical protein
LAIVRSFWQKIHRILPNGNPRPAPPRSSEPARRRYSVDAAPEFAAGDPIVQLPTTVTNPISAPATQALGRGLPWRAGAVLQAVVLDASAAGRVQLQIGSHTVSARTLFALSEGQVLSLRVSHAGELVVLQPPAAAQAQQAAQTPDAQLARQALREALPRQAPLPPLLANLTLIAREPGRFPQGVVDAANAALATLPDARVLADPDGLAERVERSGLWLEAALSRSGTSSAPMPAAALAGDWKAALLRLAAALRDLSAQGARAQPGAPAPDAAVADDARGATPLPNASPGQGAQPAPARTSPVVVDGTPLPRAAEGAPSQRADALTPAQAAVRTAAPPVGASVAEESAQAPAPAPQGAADGRAAPRVAVGAYGAPDAAPLLRAMPPQPQPRAEASLAQLALAADEPAALARHVLHQVEGALARVELGQLASLRSEGTNAPFWLLELPVRAPDGETDVLQLRIERDGGGTDAQGLPVWAVSLTFDFGALGPVHARVAVRGEQVSTLFSAEREATVARLRGELGSLESAFAQRGLTVGALGCRAGAPEAAHESAGTAAGPLLDVDA